MKKTLLTLAVLMLAALAKLSAQTIVPTWYVIPPTSGCNGVWAVDAQVYGPCAINSTFSFNPPGCATFNAVTVADTTFIQLCSLPCDLYLSNTQSGQVCICGTGTMTGIEKSATSITTTYPNPATTAEGWNVWLRGPGENVTVNIYNALGQLVVSENHAQSEQIVHVDISTLTPGTYSAQVSVNDAPAFTQQLVVTN